MGVIRKKKLTNFLDKFPSEIIDEIILLDNRILGLQQVMNNSPNLSFLQYIINDLKAAQSSRLNLLKGLVVGNNIKKSFQKSVIKSWRLEDFVSRFTELKLKSGELWGHCPLHKGDDTPSFSINVEKQVYHCFGCGKGGNIINFVEDLFGVDQEEAMRLLSQKSFNKNQKID